MDYDDYRRTPALYDTLLGIPPWARYFKYASSANQLAVIAFAIYLAFASSFWSAAGYVALYLIAVSAASVIATTGLQMITVIVSSTVALIALNVGLVWWFLYG